MEKEKTNEKSQGLSKVLGPMHIWALGVGIVLVGAVSYTHLTLPTTSRV